MPRIRISVQLVDGIRRAFLVDSTTGALAGPYRTIYAAEHAAKRLTASLFPLAV